METRGSGPHRNLAVGVLMWLGHPQKFHWNKWMYATDLFICQSLHQYRFCTVIRRSKLPDCQGCPRLFSLWGGVYHLPKNSTYFVPSSLAARPFVPQDSARKAISTNPPQCSRRIGTYGILRITKFLLLVAPKYLSGFRRNFYRVTTSWYSR